MRRLSDISPQLGQLRSLHAARETWGFPGADGVRASRSFLDVPSVTGGLASIEQRIMRITGSCYGHFAPRAGLACSRRDSLLSCSHLGRARHDSPEPTRLEDETRDASEASSARCCCCCCCPGCPVRRAPPCSSRVLARVALGGLVSVSVAGCLVGASQLARLAFCKVSAPFFLAWFSTAWNVLLFPIYYAMHVLSHRGDKRSPIKVFRECLRLRGEEGVTARLFVKRAAPFCALWLATHYLYLLALRKLPPSDASALFCCNKAFVFLLSWIVLKDRFVGVRMVAAILAIAGIVMMVYVQYVDGFNHDSVVGVALAVGSASTSALYKILCKMLLGSATLGEASQFLSSLGLFDLLFVWVLPVALYFTHVEYWPSPAALPWGHVCGFACLLLVFNVLVNFGVVVTYPIFISLGVLLSVPGNAVTDALRSDVDFSAVRLNATLLICAAFVLLLLPSDWDEAVLRLLRRMRAARHPRAGRPARPATPGGRGPAPQQGERPHGTPRAAGTAPSASAAAEAAEAAAASHECHRMGECSSVMQAFRAAKLAKSAF
ncbi:solute carrier family 35 member F3 isoform X1 [Petromyzon marinus]|uniref:Thiamine transporter SLC35F3 isoform X1 n=1 Tax=Petromyzon marinus TaxID=7757 RepID=A0AAJ7TPP8_PETMA|nr:putative thiamine transporter SLC35F3 isoform X1 [Petromyzon marinus]